MLRLLLRRLWMDRRFRRLGLPVIAVCLICFGIALATWLLQRSSGSLEERASRLAAMGELVQAERLYWQALQSGPAQAPTLVGFLDNHANLVRYAEISAAVGGAPGLMQPVVGSAEIERLLASSDLDPAVETMGRYWYAVLFETGEPDAIAVTALADSRSPERWANHLLGRAALNYDDWLEAAQRFEKEGLTFPEEAQQDLEHAFALWLRYGEWDELRDRVDDPRYQEVVGPRIRLALAEHDGDWAAVLLWLWPAGFGALQPWPLFLAAVAGVLWFVFCARLGRLSEKWRFRGLLYGSAFVLGVLSIYPTLVVITVEELFLNLRATGPPVADAIYFVFGVGLREELCKLMLFLPLLPLLRRRGSRLEALTCGALVGLGFAAEENVGYFQGLDVSTALARFLTANFLHMALTALAAVAAFDSGRNRPNTGTSLSVVLPLVVLLHGAYDFFLVNPYVAEYSFLAMSVFVILSQRFLREFLAASGMQRQAGLLRLFVLSLVVLAGVSYIYATTLVGPMTAFQLIASGLLGVAILIFMFVRELGDGTV